MYNPDTQWAFFVWAWNKKYKTHGSQHNQHLSSEKDISHPAENDKYWKSGFVLGACFFFAGWSSSCLLLLWSLLTLKLSGGEWKKKRMWRWITANAVKTDNMAAQSTTESVFLFHLSLWACLLHKRTSISRESYQVSAAVSTCQSVKPGRTAIRSIIIRRQARRQWS